MNEAVVLSHVQAAPLLQARQAGKGRAVTSPDLGLTTVEVLLEPAGVVWPDGRALSWEKIEEVAHNQAVCFVLVAGGLEKVQRFSDTLGRFYSLMPTAGAPTLLVSGVPMHRIKGVHPYQDTLRKVRTIAPLRGQVLDTCTGLGYTAIVAARTADQVVTIELDPTVLEVARLNPWSRPLFEDRRIRQVIGDAFEVLPTFEDESFARIIHDPPRFSLAGELYSGACYRQLFRVLAPRGRLFHYVGNPDSRSGRNVTRGVMRRLQEAGFSRVLRRPHAFGLVAYK